ncbi:MAG: hypothetical protein DHS20C11_13080 [Lysobacteraceae bacterium]|nr:MAG: hypothetical protein DHS20C11_13080 [Xanthomonadaceae bacterium]
MNITATHGKATRRFQRGLTLIELLISLILLGVVIAIGVPSFVTFTNNAQVTDETNRFVGDIQFARSQAINRSIMVSMCRFDTVATACTQGGNCTCGTGAANRAYEEGWLIYTNNDTDHIFEPAEGDILLRVASPSSGSVTIRGSDTGNRRFSFDATGAMHVQDQPGTAHVVCVNNSISDHDCRVVRTSASGHVETRRISGSTSITPNDHDFD